LMLRTSSLSQVDGIALPSAYIIGCCGIPGSYPILSLYLLNNLGLIITPIDLILCCLIPTLVGLNTSLILLTFHSKGQKVNENEYQRTNIMTIIGSSFGILTSCPSCAGGLFVSFFGLASTLAGFSLNYLNNDLIQILFTIISLTTLTYSIFLLKKQFFRSCRLKGRESISNKFTCFQDMNEQLKKKNEKGSFRT
jgi:hypothetical protein